MFKILKYSQTLSRSPGALASPQLDWSISTSTFRNPSAWHSHRLLTWAHQIAFPSMTFGPTVTKLERGGEALATDVVGSIPETTLVVCVELAQLLQELRRFQD